METQTHLFTIPHNIAKVTQEWAGHTGVFLMLLIINWGKKKNRSIKTKLTQIKKGLGNFPKKLKPNTNIPIN